MDSQSLSQKTDGGLLNNLLNSTISRTRENDRGIDNFSKFNEGKIN
jgi:hypothetical protein